MKVFWTFVDRWFFQKKYFWVQSQKSRKHFWVQEKIANICVQSFWTSKNGSLNIHFCSFFWNSNFNHFFSYILLTNGKKFTEKFVNSRRWSIFLKKKKKIFEFNVKKSCKHFEFKKKTANIWVQGFWTFKKGSLNVHFCSFFLNSRMFAIFSWTQKCLQFFPDPKNEAFKKVQNQ